MKIPVKMAVTTVSLLATAIIGCEDQDPTRQQPETITLVIQAEVTGVVAWSGSPPLGVVEGQSLSIALTFLPLSARLLSDDSLSAAYNLDPRSENRIAATIGALDWDTRLHQVILHNDTPFLGDRIAVNGHRYESPYSSDAIFDFKDSTAPYDMVSSRAFPSKREDITEQLEGAGGGTLSYAGGGSSWRVSFLCRKLTVN